MDITHIFTIVSVIIAVFSALFAGFSAHNAAISLQRNNRLTSMTLATDALKAFAADKDMQDAFFSIEYDKFRYTVSFHDSPEERRMDKMLYHLSAVALAWKNGFIQEEDLGILQYYVVRILRNDGIQEYFDFLLKKWTKSQRLEHPYHTLVKLGEHLDSSPSA